MEGKGGRGGKEEGEEEGKGGKGARGGRPPLSQISGSAPAFRLHYSGWSAYFYIRNWSHIGVIATSSCFSFCCYLGTLFKKS